MTRYKDFGSGNDSVQREPLVFKLHGEEFTCKPAIQGKALLNLAAKTGGDDPAKAAETIDQFFDFVLASDDNKQRFQALLTDADKIVSVETLSEIVAWLVEEYTQRPNQQPEA
jgi:hypothetical protein